MIQNLIERYSGTAFGCNITVLLILLTDKAVLRIDVLDQILKSLIFLSCDQLCKKRNHNGGTDNNDKTNRPTNNQTIDTKINDNLMLDLLVLFFFSVFLYAFDWFKSSRIRCALIDRLYRCDLEVVNYRN
ncbi:hypothetical protein CW304_22450 [Bacillus sp. UFRGS-B20]|nr:hypothetical protein CW304_22450 [Bacillus sp. UFRGS-B20]